MGDNRLFLSTDLDQLAGQLERQLRGEEESFGDPFLPANLIVPSLPVKNWLRLFLARRQSIAINLRMQYLESALWDIIGALTQPTDGAAPAVTCLEHDRYRLLVLGLLLDPKVGGADLKPLRQYLGAPDQRSREFCRRVWQTADTVARLVRDYEYHRQDEFIQAWLKNETALTDASADTRALELCQRTIFRLIVDEKSGLRAELSRIENRSFKTLPQFANEVILERGVRARTDWPLWLRRPIHVFGAGQMSTYHVNVLKWLSGHLDLRLYHAGPLVMELPADIKRKPGAHKVFQAIARKYSVTVAPEGHHPLLQRWAQAEAASFHCFSELLRDGNFAVDVGAPPEAANATVLRRVQQSLLQQKGATTVLQQDKSLQIVACPGHVREIETVYQSILDNLQRDPSLRLADIGVLVSDMQQYGPVIQGVFSRSTLESGGTRKNAPLPFQLADSTTGESSVMGQALLGMLDMALDGFTRTSVIRVLMNPCLLARLNIDRESAAVWLDWAERLGVYHGWDRADKAEAGYSNSRLYSWKLALQRLRLGRIMQPADSNNPTIAYQGVAPYSDLHSSDPQQLETFCHAIEELVPRLLSFRNTPAGADAWVQRLSGLLNDFLTVPDGYAEDEQIKTALLATFPQLRTVAAAKSSGAQTLSMALVREFVLAVLQNLSAVGRGAGAGGIQIAALQHSRVLPRRIIYLVGLGEGIFPTGEVASPFDLREQRRLPGDLKPQDTQRMQFLEAILAAREKLYLSFNCRELQKDQVLHPSPLLTKLRQHIETQVLQSPFEITAAPLHPHDAMLLQPSSQNAKSDVLVTHANSERLLAVQEIHASGRLAGPHVPRAVEALQQLSRQHATLFATPAGCAETRSQPLRVTVRELAAFLRNPVDAALKRHLRLHDDRDIDHRDDEPFYTDGQGARTLVQHSLTNYAMAFAQSGPEDPPNWQADLEHEYDARARQGQTPDGAFREADLRRFQRLIDERINGDAGLNDWLAERQQTMFCGPVQLGIPLTPNNAVSRFPATRLRVPIAGETHEVLLDGSSDLLWSRDDCIEILTVLEHCDADKVPREKLTQFLFEPVLFYLALACGDNTAENAQPSAEWVRARPLKAVFGLDDCFVHYDYRNISPADARAYLEDLAAAYLNPVCFDHLPFHVLSTKDLLPAYEETDEAKLREAEIDFAARLQAAIEEDDEKFFGGDDRLRSIDLIDAKVPPDAFSKVRRRFHLIDQGPRNNRQSFALFSKARPSRRTKS